MKTKIVENNLDKILKGLNTCADIVTSTMGYNGKNVVIADNYGNLKFTKDGISVAKSINLVDPVENIGAQILISAANKTVKEVGDGTTLSSLLLKEMISSTLKEIEKSNDINRVLDDLEIRIEEVISRIRKISKKVNTPKTVRRIAEVASKSDKIGSLFEEIYSQTGMDTKIILEKSEHNNTTYYEILNGIEFNSGYVHPSFMTDKNSEQCIYENAYIHVDEAPILDLTPNYKALLTTAHSEGIPLIIIAPKFSDAFIRMCSMNKTNQNVPVCLIKTPGYGHNIIKNIDDIRAFLSEDGTVEKIIVTDYDFTIFNSDSPFLSSRIEQLQRLADSAKDKYEQEEYINRMYRLKGSTAIIYTGYVTGEQQNEEYDRIEDAIGAVNSASRFGYVPGGGITLLYASTFIDNHFLCNVLKTPFKKILDNSNIDVNSYPEVPLFPFGINTKSRQVEDFYKTGILDATEVLVQALRNAFTNTKLIVNTSYTLYNE